MTDKCRQALAELVAIKDLHDTCENSPSDADADEGVIAMWQEYRRRKPLAWAAARAALDESADKPGAPGLKRQITPDVGKLVGRLRSLSRNEQFKDFDGTLLDSTDAADAMTEAADALEAVQAELSASEAVYGFAGWLTCRDGSTTFGATHNATLAADLVDAFCKSQKLPEPRQQWAGKLKPYPVSGEAAPVGLPAGKQTAAVATAPTLTEFQRMRIIGDEFPLALVDPLVIAKVDSVCRAIERAVKEQT